MVKQKINLLILFIALALPATVSAQNNSAFDRGSFITKGDTLPYRILFPEYFDPTKTYPLLVVLHGAGERGNDNEAQLKYGTKLFMQDTIREKYAAIVVFPQCPLQVFGQTLTWCPIR